MGNIKAKTVWTPCSIQVTYGFRYEQSAVIGLPLNPLWDTLPGRCKYLVERDQYLHNGDLRTHIQSLYSDGLAFAVRTIGEESFEVTNTLDLHNSPYFSFLIIACTPSTMVKLCHNLDGSALEAQEDLRTRYEMRIQQTTLTT
jgi:hypothetical protein